MEAVFEFLVELLSGLFEGVLDALFDRPKKDAAPPGSGPDEPR